MPRTASVITLRDEPTILSFHDSSDRFARATLLLMQIAQRNGLEIKPDAPPTPNTKFVTCSAAEQPHKSSTLS